MPKFCIEDLEKMIEKVVNQKVNFEPIVILFPLRFWEELVELGLTRPLDEPDEHGYLGLASVAGSYAVQRYIEQKIPIK